MEISMKINRHIKISQNKHLHPERSSLDLDEIEGLDEIQVSNEDEIEDLDESQDSDLADRLDKIENLNETESLNLDHDTPLDGSDDSDEPKDLTYMESEEDIEFLDDFDLPQKKASRKKSNLHINMHILLVSAIVLIAIISVYRLNKWNKGSALDDDTPDVDPSQFDVETLDMIIPMDSSLLEGRQDDGVTTILCLGNNPFTDDHGDTSLASQIAQKTNAVVYDCAFPDSSVACKYPVYNPEYTRDHFNFYYVVECLRNNEFTAIASIANDEPDPRYADTVEIMKTVDMDKVDIIVIMYDSTDYNMGTVADNPNNPYDVTAYTGGLRTTISNIKNTWPHIRILVMSHTYAQYMDDNGELYNGTLKDIGNGTLHHYLLMEAEAAMDCGVSFIDNYFGTINEDNYEEYMSNYMHYNDAGREKLAERVADIINNHMGIVSSGSAR
ncbi:hypothetical protein D5281_06570 [bacterium 1xD42-62]|uniref:SGNH/GDSL hydrolase family protein n=2 Tax=Parablautia muri TaxID=2320879 RepID=A0A9X5BEB5_9FIRM|nr:hypothetical protein [Parablautia muri]